MFDKLNVIYSGGKNYSPNTIDMLNNVSNYTMITIRTLFGALLIVMFLTSFKSSRENLSAISNKSIGDSTITSVTVGDLKISDIVVLEGNKPLDCRNLRLRRLDVFPGADVGIHSHENRPALLSVARGKGAEMHAYKHEPIEVPYGASYKEYNNIVHYALNLDKSDTLSIITFDLLDDGASCGSMTYPQYTPLFDQMKSSNDPFYINAPKFSTKAEVSYPIYSSPIQDIKFPEGTASLQDRHLRVRRVTMEVGATTGMQDYANRPTYIMGLEGSIEVHSTTANNSETIRPLGTANLVNTDKVEIKNTTNQKAVYFVMELWDPADENAATGMESESKSGNHEIERIDQGTHFSQVVKTDDIMILTGQVSDGANIAEQTEAVLKKIDSLLNKAGARKSDIISATVYLTDMSEFELFNSAWEKWVDKDNLPARTTVQVAALAQPRWKIEIQVTAAVPD